MSMSRSREMAIRDCLIRRGKALFRAPRERIEFTRNEAADSLLNDLAGQPHAFVLACVMDRQVKAEKAWIIPYKISKKIGSFSIRTLKRLSVADVTRLMTKPEPLHRFVKNMSYSFHSAVQRIARQYEGDAGRIWKGRPQSAEVAYRFLEFDGVGPKIASMATNILAREFKIPFSDYSAIDISADVHVKRVFARLGLCSADASVEQIIYKAKGLYPKFPGLLDSPCWKIGHDWCKPHRPDCAKCYMRELCPSAN